MAVGSAAVNVGDIVQRRRSKGTIIYSPSTDNDQEIGLIIERKADKGYFPQYRVRFPSNPDKPLWFGAHQLRKAKTNAS